RMTIYRLKSRFSRLLDPENGAESDSISISNWRYEAQECYSDVCVEISRQLAGGGHHARRSEGERLRCNPKLLMTIIDRRISRALAALSSTAVGIEQAAEERTFDDAMSDLIVAEVKARCPHVCELLDIEASGIDEWARGAGIGYEAAKKRAQR